MKQLHIYTRVMDSETMEYVQRTLTLDVTDSQAQRFAELYREITSNPHNCFPASHGFGTHPADELDMDSPLGECEHDFESYHNRFVISNDFGILDEYGEQINGFQNF